MKTLSYISLIACLLPFLSCQSDNKRPPQALKAMPFPVVEVPLRSVTGYTSYPVSIEGKVNSAIRAKTPAYIKDVLVDEGQAVKKGQTLFELETQTLSEDAGAAKANMNAAQVEVNKLKPLVEKGIISDVQLQTASARLAQARASYNSIIASIGYATIKSPIDGFVGAIAFREGALVGPADATPLTIVSAIDEVYAFFAVNERDYLDILQTTRGGTLAEKIKNFPPVELELVNGDRYPQKGRIETVSGQVNPATGTVSFRATFPNPNRLLANGSSAKIRIPKRYENVAVVPEAATFEQQGKVYVYRVQGDSLAISSSIEVKDRIENLVIVASGIKAGDKIVAKGTGSLKDNTPIQPRPVAFDSIANSLNVVFK